MKSWISKALLGLCLVVPTAMAYLPTIPGRYSAIKLRTNGFTNAQQTMIKNSFGLLSLTNTYSIGPKFRLTGVTGDPDQVTFVTFNLIHGSVPGSGNCSQKPNYLCNNFRITARSVANPSAPAFAVYPITSDIYPPYNNVIVDIYTHVKRSSSAGGDVVWKGTYDSLTLTNNNLFQNLLTDLWGYVFSPDRPIGNFGEHRAVVRGMISTQAPYTSKIVPSADISFPYCQGYTCTQSSADGILEFNVMDATNTSVIGKKYLDLYSFNTGRPSNLVTANMQLASARYLAGYTRSNFGSNENWMYLVDGRIGIKDMDNQIIQGCYPVSIPNTLQPFYTSSDWSQSASPDLTDLIAAGLRSQLLNRQQNWFGDLLTNPVSGGNCTSALGYVGDVLQ